MFVKFANRSSFAKSIIALVSATAVAQAINFGFNILLTRLYTPVDFGALSVFLSLVSFVAVVSTGKYDVALVAAPDRDEARGLVSLGMFICILTALVILILAWLVNVIPLHFYSQNQVHEWFYLIPLSLIMLSAFQMLWMWNVREKKFKSISFIRPLEAFVNNAICIGLKSYKSVGLLTGSLTSQFVSLVTITVISLTKTEKNLFFAPIKKLQNLAVKYIEFPKINILQGFIDTLQMGIIVLVSSNYFPAADIGYYALCMRVLQAPVRLIVLPLAHVFFAEVSSNYREDKGIYNLVRKVTYQTGVWTVAMPVVLITVGPFLFKIIFGINWQEAGVYAAILSPWIFFDMLRAPIVQVASIIGKQKQVLVISIISNVVLLLSIIFALCLGLHFNVMLLIISITQSLMNVYLILIIFRMSRLADRMPKV
jgi:O-antigen/teichoic acid export membrane protein